MANEAIKTVNTSPITAQPSTYRLKYQDISGEEAGRTEDAKMQKHRLGTVTAIELQWNNLTTSEGSAIIDAFWNEYVNVEYLDLKTGGYVTDEFYSGDKDSNLYNAALGVWESISFNIIRRDAQ